MFDGLWKFCCQRSAAFPVVQQYDELKHIFELMQGCQSYLEVGTAEGNSLYVLAHALAPGAHITYVDFDEEHTRIYREQVTRLLRDQGYSVEAIHGDTRNPDVIQRASQRVYDCVLIDAGHTYEEVASDFRNYAHLANKYVFAHDVMIPDVDRALNEFAPNAPRYIRSDKFGYGIIKK